jgi:hypothetical protein
MVAAGALAIAGVTGTIVVMQDGQAEAGYSLSAATAEAADASTVAMHMSMSMSSLGEVEADMAIDVDTGLMQATMDVEGTTMDMLMDVSTGVMYMRADEFPLDADQWVRFDIADVTGTSGTSGGLGGPGGLGGLGDDPLTNPLDMAAAFESASSVEDLGVEDVDGESLKHYRLGVDTSAVADLVGGASSDIELPDELIYDVWVDAGGSMRRMSFELAMLGQTIEYDITITSIGEPLDIEVPDADHVVSMADVFGGALGDLMGATGG